MKPKFVVLMHSGALVGRRVGTNAQGRGVYELRPIEGSDEVEVRFHRAASLTPVFKSSRQFAQYVRRHFPKGKDVGVFV